MSLPEDQDRRQNALGLAVEATKHHTNSLKSTVEWAMTFDHYIKTGQFKFVKVPS